MTLKEVRTAIRSIIRQVDDNKLCELLDASRNRQMPFEEPAICLAGRLGLGTAWTVTAWWYRELGIIQTNKVTFQELDYLRQARIIPIIKAEIKRRLNEKNNSNSSLYNDSSSNREYGIKMAITKE